MNPLEHIKKNVNWILLRFLSILLGSVVKMVASLSVVSQGRKGDQQGYATL